MFFYESDKKNKCQEKNHETTIKKSLVKKYLDNVQVRKESFGVNQDEKMCRSWKI